MEELTIFEKYKLKEDEFIKKAKSSYDENKLNKLTSLIRCNSHNKNEQKSIKEEGIDLIFSKISPEFLQLKNPRSLTKSFYVDYTRDKEYWYQEVMDVQEITCRDYHLIQNRSYQINGNTYSTTERLAEIKGKVADVKISLPQFAIYKFPNEDEEENNKEENDEEGDDEEDEKKEYNNFYFKINLQSNLTKHCKLPPIKMLKNVLDKENIDIGLTYNLKKAIDYSLKKYHKDFFIKNRGYIVDYRELLFNWTFISDFQGYIPNTTIRKINLVRPLFNDIYIISEANNWQVYDQIRKGYVKITLATKANSQNPMKNLLIGTTKNSFYLIDHFKSKSLQEILEGEHSVNLNQTSNNDEWNEQKNNEKQRNVEKKPTKSSHQKENSNLTDAQKETLDDINARFKNLELD